MLTRSRTRGAWAVAVGLSLLLPAALPANQAARASSSSEGPSFYDGLYYLTSGTDEDDPRALVLSHDGQPVWPKLNEPDAPTRPGFYLSYEERHEFKKVEVKGRRVYFRTRRQGGVSYVFKGTAGWITDPDFYPPEITFIKGTLTQCKDGRALKREKVKFSHAVIL